MVWEVVLRCFGVGGMYRRYREFIIRKGRLVWVSGRWVGETGLDYGCCLRILKLFIGNREYINSLC